MPGGSGRETRSAAGRSPAAGASGGHRDGETRLVGLASAVCSGLREEPAERPLPCGALATRDGAPRVCGAAVGGVGVKSLRWTAWVRVSHSLCKRRGGLLRRECGLWCLGNASARRCKVNI